MSSSLILLCLFAKLILSEEEDSMCYMWVYPENMMKPYNSIELTYSINDSELIPITRSFCISELMPFNFKMYLKYSYCSNWEIFYEDYVSDDAKCTPKNLVKENVSEKCLSGNTLTIYSNFKLGYYYISIVTPTNESHELFYQQTFNYYYYDSFSVDIYLHSNEYLHGKHYLETITVNETMTKEYNDSVIPDNLSPYNVDIFIDLPYYYKLGYIDENNETIMFTNKKNYSFKYADPIVFNISLYSTPSCNYEEGRQILEITAEQNSKCRNIIINDIPEECSNDKYPDDTPKYQPNQSDNPNFPYYFIYISDKCNRYDNLLKRCKNKRVNYSMCNFVLNAVGSQCYFLYNPNTLYIPPETNKLYFVDSSGGVYDFRYLQHQMIVHIKGTEYEEPEDYFKNPDVSPLGNNINVFFRDGNLNKVSNLILENIYIKLPTNIILQVDTLYLKNCNTYDVLMPNNVIVDNTTFTSPAKHQFNQYTVVLRNKTKRPQYRIHYDKENPSIYYKDYDEQNYKVLKGMPKYTRVKSYGAIFAGHYFDVYNANPAWVLNFYPLNLTLMDFDVEFPYVKNPAQLSDEPKYYVNLTTSGDWSKLHNKEKIYVTAYHDLVEVENNVDPHINVTKEDPYVYESVKWTPFLYQPIDYTDKSIISYIVISDQNNLYRCNNYINSILQCRWTECKNKIDLFDYIIEGKCVTRDTLQETLRTIHQDVDKVYIENDVDYVSIDLSQLSHQVAVQITSYQSLFDLVESSSKQLLSTDYSRQIWKSITLNGDIKSQVSHLTISNSFISITNANLNPYTLKLVNSDLENSFYSFNPQMLIVDYNTHAYFLMENVQLHVPQYVLLVPYDEFEDEAEYRVQYNTNDWSLYCRYSANNNYEPVHEKYGYVPYQYSDTVGLIAISQKFDINFNSSNSNIYTLKKVNITVLNENGINKNTLKYVPPDESKYTITLTASGKTPSGKSTITINCFQDYIDVISKSGYLNVQKSEVFKFTPHQLVIPAQTAHPYPTMSPSPTSIPIKTPVPELYDKIDYNEEEIDDLDKINTDLDLGFERLDGEEKEGNQIIYLNAKSFPFNREMKNNQYIIVNEETTIDYTGGDLNLILKYQYGKNVTVALKESDINFGLKGNGNIILESDKAEINIKKKAIINGSVKFTVPENVKSMSFDSIDLVDQGYYSSWTTDRAEIVCKSNNGKVPITVNKITADSSAKALLNSVAIKDTITIDQGAQIYAEDTDFSSAKMVYNIYNFERNEYVLMGEFDKAPANFDIQVFVNPESIEYRTVDIISGYFEDGICQQWADSIKMVNYQSCIAQCNQFAQSKLLERYYNVLYLIFNPTPTPNENSKSGLSGGAIAGIVIGVIAGVAIIAAVIVFFVIKKRKSNYKSTGSMNEGDEQVNEEV